MDRILFALLIVVAAPAATALYIVLAEGAIRPLSDRRRAAIQPWFWLGPGVLLLAGFLVYPSAHTAVLSLFNADSTSFVGGANYAFIATDPAMHVALRNNLLWVVLFTGFAVGLGLLTAVLTDRVPYEGTARSVIFLPMVISFVAAGVIWRFMYDYRPPGVPQTGTLNAVLMALVPGFEPRAWFIDPPLNNLALIAAAVWTWTGFCMVILSAALKGIPIDVLEAARVDGASELQVFLRIVLPLISPTIAMVATTMVIFALKAFDVVYVMTNGNYDTEVIANRMYKEMFNFRDFGRASAIAVVLLVAIVPVMLLNVNRFRAQEGRR